MLLGWWEAAAALEPTRVVGPDAETRLATPKSVQTALRALSRSAFFTSVAERAMIGDLKQVGDYLTDSKIRTAAVQAVDKVVGEDTTVIVGHSLGSVVAYEALCRHRSDPRWASVTTFVTLGSPIGIRHLIFDRLDPAPIDGHGVWPGVERWVNVSDDGGLAGFDPPPNAGPP